MHFSQYMKKYRAAALLCLLAIIQVAGCGITDSVKETVDEVYPDRKKIDYKKAETINTLEVPPDLTSSTLDTEMVVPDLDPASSASYSDYTRERSGKSAALRSEAVLPSYGDIRVARDAHTHWLVIPTPPDQVWPKMREFWLQMGFLIKREDPRIGILETDWAENRADIKSDFIRDFIGKLFDKLYSAATRDKFRVRLERGIEPGTSELYLTHYGAEEVIETRGETAVWKPRPNDPELEIEMLRRIAVSLGVDEDKSRTLFARQEQSRPERARLVRTGSGITLNLNDEFGRAWRRTGVALDRVGFTVEDRDRSKGIYYVRYYDPLADSSKMDKGWLDKFIFWDDKDKKSEKKYQIHLAAVSDAGTRVEVLNEQGQSAEARVADRILTLLHEQLK